MTEFCLSKIVWVSYCLTATECIGSMEERIYIAWTRLVNSFRCLLLEVFSVLS